MTDKIPFGGKLNGVFNKARMKGAGVAQLIDEEEFPQGAVIELFAAFCKTDFTKSSKYCYITKQAMSGMNDCLQKFSESDGTHHDTPVNHGTMPYRKIIFLTHVGAYGDTPLLKDPDRPHPPLDVLVADTLVPVAETLEPCESSSAVLRRTPVAVVHKTPNSTTYIIHRS